MINVIYCGSSSACFELENDRPYYAPDAYTVLLDGKKVKEGEANVFSLFGLTPDTAYTASVRFASGGEDQVTFTTAGETSCANVKDFGAVGDGVQEDTQAIQAAINFLPEGGRGPILRCPWP